MFVSVGKFLKVNILQSHQGAVFFRNGQYQIDSYLGDLTKELIALNKRTPLSRPQ